MLASVEYYDQLKMLAATTKRPNSLAIKTTYMADLSNHSG